VLEEEESLRRRREKRNFNKGTVLTQGMGGHCTYIRDIHGKGHAMTWNRN
jgi:hypothetical protein